MSKTPPDAVLGPADETVEREKKPVDGEELKGNGPGVSQSPATDPGHPPTNDSSFAPPPAKSALKPTDGAVALETLSDEKTTASEVPPPPPPDVPPADVSPPVRDWQSLFAALRDPVRTKLEAIISSGQILALDLDERSVFLLSFPSLVSLPFVQRNRLEWLLTSRSARRPQAHTSRRC